MLYLCSIWIFTVPSSFLGAGAEDAWVGGTGEGEGGDLTPCSSLASLANTDTLGWVREPFSLTLWMPRLMAVPSTLSK